MLSCVEYEKKFYNLGLGITVWLAAMIVLTLLKHIHKCFVRITKRLAVTYRWPGLYCSMQQGWGKNRKRIFLYLMTEPHRGSAVAQW